VQKKDFSLSQIFIYMNIYDEVEQAVNKLYLEKKLNEEDIVYRQFTVSFDGNGRPLVLAVIEYKQKIPRV